MKVRAKFWIKMFALMVFTFGTFPVFGQGAQRLKDGSVIIPICGNNLVQIDPQGRLEGVLNSRGGLTTFSYDDSGNLAQRTAADLKITDYGYDNLNRLVAVTNEG